MKILVQSCLVVITAACFVLAAYLLYGPKEKETWAILASLLAVIAAAIAVLPALRVLEIQEDAVRPRPVPHFDLSSRYHLLQLRVKNFGGGVAYDVHLKWKKHPVDHKGKEITSLDQISVLLPQDSVSTLVGAAPVILKDLSQSRFQGECHFRDCTGKTYRDGFVCSVDGNLKQLLHNDEMLKALRDVQDIPTELGRIADLLEKLTQQQIGGTGTRM